MTISFAAYSRFQRASMLETLNSDYVRTARAKGLSQRRVIFRHAFRNALIPVARVFSLNIGAVFIGGAIITENGVRLAGHGHVARDRPCTTYDPWMLMGWLVVTADVRHRVQPDRGHPVRLPRPEDSPWLTQPASRGGGVPGVALDRSPASTSSTHQGAQAERW